MNVCVKSTIFVLAAVLFTGALSVAVRGQGQPARPQGQPAAPAAARPQAPAPGSDVILSDQLFKNVQVLKGITIPEFMGTMGVFSASLGMSCEDCHAADDRAWENFAVDNARKRQARRMITMMQELNKNYFGGRQVVTCFSCHRGADRPRTAADLDILYGELPPDPRHVIAQAPNQPTAESIIDKYIQAIGGAQRLAAITSFTATGQAVGYGPESAEDRKVELYARGPNQLTLIIHTGNGDITQTHDGKNVWIAAPLRQPVPVMTLSGQELDAANLDVVVAFPAQLKTALTKWRTGIPTTIDDKEVNVVQGTTMAGVNATFFFDAESGLLVRQMRYVDSPVGPLVTRVDYDDYKDVNGVKMPHHVIQTWLDGRENITLDRIQANVNVPAARFNKPAPPVAPPARN
jgi:hypothetical protein